MILQRFITCLALCFALLLTPHEGYAQAKPALEKIIQGGASRSLGIPVDDRLLTDFYGRRHFTPAWQLNEGGADDVVKEFIGFIRSVLEEHGLTSARYPFAALEHAIAQKGDDAIAKADIIASDIVLRLARSLAGQDPVPQSDMHTWPLRREKVDIAGGLNKSVSTQSVSEYLEGLVPHNAAYSKLKEALKDYRAIAAKGGWAKIKPGVILHPDDPDMRVPSLHQRLAQEGLIEFDRDPKPSLTMKPELVEALRLFQDTHGLYPDGILGLETVRALNVPVASRIDQLRVNLARIRQSPPDAWENIVINLPSAKLTYYRDTQPVYEAPVVVGRIDRQSPLVTSALYEMIINPYWYVPASIAEKDLYPKLEKDPNFFEKQGIRVHGGEGKNAVLRQDPGPLNSLGRLKFNFHNRHAVYLHGTPHSELFGLDDRTRSSGCIRLKEPMELALILLKDTPEWTAEKIQDKIELSKTLTVPLKTHTPIKLLYWTATVDQKNRVNFYNDIYSLDTEWAKLL